MCGTLKADAVPNGGCWALYRGVGRFKQEWVPCTCKGSYRQFRGPIGNCGP